MKISPSGAPAVRRFLSCAVLCGTGLYGAGLSAASAVAQDRAPEKRLLTLEGLFAADPAQRLDFTGATPPVEWIDDERWLERRPLASGAAGGPAENGNGNGDLRVLTEVHARSGRAEPFFDHDRMVEALDALPGMDRSVAEKLAHGELKLNQQRTAALLNHAKDLFLYRFETGKVTRLTEDPAEEVGEEWSPDGRFVSFVRDYDLHLLDLETGKERPLTDGGGPELFFGRLDWVYQEEIYGRGNFKGYWWSPDSTRIAYLKLDESAVREFTVVDHIPTELELEVTNYPKAGSPNPEVALGVVSVLGGDTVWLDTSEYEPIEHLIVRVGWTPDSNGVAFQVQDREQRWLELLLGDPATGATETLLREESPAFVQVLGEPKWLEKGVAAGGFLWLSERTGYRHVYRYDAEGELVTPLTTRESEPAEWEVRSLDGVDEDDGFVYFTAMRHDPIAPQLYRVPLAGAGGGDGIERLSGKDGSHSAEWSPGFELYVDTWSDVRTPTERRLHRADGARVRVLPVVPEKGRPIVDVDRFVWGAVERFQVPTRDGFPMEAMLIKPPDFDAAKRYPVLQYNYGGPHAPVVRDAWVGARYLWHQYLATRHDVVVFMADNRSASGKGIAPTWQAYQRLGEPELRDIEDGVAWLKLQPWVDPERIGIWGWSYGGFMASFALTHSESFRMGIAGAPVTDWRLYDTVYTERYMRMPQNNPDGYDATSVVKAAGDLHGDLLLIHGTMDDNVHLQNTMQLVHELQRAGKQFELMLYPKSRHGVRDPAQELHLYRLMTDFVQRKLLPEPAAP